MVQKQKAKGKPSNQALLLIVGAIVAVVVIAGAVIFLSTSGATATGAVDYSQIPQERLPDGGFVLGNPEARVTIVAFEDFLCPHCQNYTRTVIHPFIEQYVVTGQARFEFRVLPAVDPTFSAIAGNFVVCADTVREGSFWEAHDVMFALTSSQRFSQETPRIFADRMDMSYSELLTCTGDATQVQTDSQLATRVGANATPTVMIRIDGGEIQQLPRTQLSLSDIANLISQYQ